MGGQEPKIHPGDPPQEARPQSKPPRPAKEQNEQQREANQHVPPAGRREGRRGVASLVPNRKLVERQGKGHSSDNEIGKSDHNNLCPVRIEQRAGGCYCRVIRSAVLVGYKPGIGKMPYDGIEPWRALRFSQDEQWRGDEVPRMDIHFPKYRRNSIGVKAGQDQKRDPPHHCDYQRATANVELATPHQPETALETYRRSILKQCFVCVPSFIHLRALLLLVLTAGQFKPDLTRNPDRIPLAIRRGASKRH
ncbi:hypothetical protein MESS4_670039 [Mesorhizobium sp. STM 4661]|nr:hypothetical protein MESS4_670039 [Mesorhizobium sp. STM 4661]